MTVASQRSPHAAAAGRLGGVARGGALNLIGAGYAAVVGFGTATVVTRGLTPTAAGVFFTATALFVLFSVVAKLGTPTGLVYWLARLRTHGHHGLIRRCIEVALRPVVCAAVLAGVVGYLGAPWLARVTGEDGPLFAEQLRILAWALPVAAVSDTLLAATRGHRTMRPTVLVDRVARPTLQLVGLLVALGTAASIGWYTVAWAAPWVLTTLIAWLWLRTLLPGRPAAAAPSVTVDLGGTDNLGRRFWAFTWPRGAANVLALLLQRFDVLLVAALVGFAPAAAYAVATRFTVVGQLGNAAIGTAVEPRLAEALARHDHRSALQLYQGATAWLVLATWPLYLLAAVFAPLYLSLFGPAYRTAETIAVVVMLSAAMLVASGCGMVDVVLAMTGRTVWNLGNAGVALVVNIGLNLVLLPQIGILGAGIAWAAAVLVKNLLPLAQLAARRGLHPYGRATLTAVGLALACFGALPLLTLAVLGPTGAALLLAASVSTACYLLGVWRLRGSLQLSAFTALRRGFVEVA